MTIQGPNPSETNTPLSFDYTKEREGNGIQNTTYMVGQKIFRAKACSGIGYTFSDRIKKALVFVVKWALFPITLPSVYFIKKFAVQQAIADERSKIVDEELVRQLEDLGGKQIGFEAEDGVKLTGMMFNSKEPRSGKTIIVCSGNRYSQEHYNVPIVKALLFLGYNVMTFNYRGFGRSEGEASESGLYMDGEAAYQYILDQGIAANDLVVYGYSLGGAIATDVAAKHAVKVVLDRTFSSGPDKAAEIAPKWLGWLARMIAFIGCNFDNTKKLRYVKSKIFIYQEHENNRHHTFLKRMKIALSQTRRASIKSLEASGSVITAHGTGAHLHTEDTLWFGAGNQSENKNKLQTFLVQKQ